MQLRQMVDQLANLVRVSEHDDLPQGAAAVEVLLRLHLAKLKEQKAVPVGTDRQRPDGRA